MISLVYLEASGSISRKAPPINPPAAKATKKMMSFFSKSSFMKRASTPIKEIRLTITLAISAYNKFIGILTIIAKTKRYGIVQTSQMLDNRL